MEHAGSLGGRVFKTNGSYRSLAEIQGLFSGPHQCGGRVADVRIMANPGHLIIFYQFEIHPLEQFFQIRTRFQF